MTLNIDYKNEEISMQLKSVRHPKNRFIKCNQILGPITKLLSIERLPYEVGTCTY